MPSTVFTTPEAAEKSYKDWHFTPVDSHNANIDRENDKKLFCKIATFLSNKASFENELRLVSAMLWDIYITIPTQANNRFTSAISKLAEIRGFQMTANQPPLGAHGAPMHIKLVNNDPELGYMLRNRVFWKDSMDARHGEHSHSLQWLAVASKFGALAPQAYAKSGLYRATNVAPDKYAYVWQWLADCFPLDMQSLATDCTKQGSTESLCSDTYRSPQKITDYLVRNPCGPLKNHFISHYLHRRYVNRNWLPSGGEYTKGDLAKLANEAKSNAEAKKAAGGWTNSPRPGETGLARWIRTGAPTPKTTAYTDVVEFHGRTGIL